MLMVSTGLGFAAGFASSILLGRLTGFRRVAEAYSCKLRNGMFAGGLVLGVVDTFRACFFFLLLLCVIHGFASTIDCWVLVSSCCRSACRTCRLIRPALALDCIVSVDGVAGRYILVDFPDAIAGRCCRTLYRTWLVDSAGFGACWNNYRTLLPDTVMIAR